MAAEQTMQARLAVHGERVVYPMLMHVEGRLGQLGDTPSFAHAFSYIVLHIF